MKPVTLHIRIKVVGFVMALCLSPLNVFASPSIPFSTDSVHLTIFNGHAYEPFFIKGVNFGIARPGTYPGELTVSTEQYQRWFAEIKEAGFNCIRLYTLLRPEFYQELRNYNVSHPHNPLFFFQGVWLEEELTGYKENLYQLADFFQNESEENINSLHGNAVIAKRAGKAYGTYSADVSKWLIGYIMGREVYGMEVNITNEKNTDTSFMGNFLSIDAGSPTEVFITRALDHVISYENDHYNSQHPVSFSSWPTLDPMRHWEERIRFEDTASVDLTKINFTKAKAGIFASYHAYPYYPDFIGSESTYQGYYDEYGRNSYLGYLTHLKQHYPHMPLIIAEYGVPSSWGVAHYTSSGLNHGGFSELDQGSADCRLLSAIRSANTGGGIQFEWLDEWFKRTWITDPFDLGNRTLWHNVTAAEQNFGLIKFDKPAVTTTLNSFGVNSDITYLNAGSDFTFFQMEVGLKSQLPTDGELWIGIDTYDSGLGESILPDGSKPATRVEFALHITPYEADLYVTEAYDLFGLWHRYLTPKQKLQSTVTDGAPWNLVRWKNNAQSESVQYIGRLTVNRWFQPESSKDAVTIYQNKIQVRLPWSLINVTNPAEKTVFHDDILTPDDTETRITDGIAFSVSYNGNVYNSNSRYTWAPWETVAEEEVTEAKKTSYWSMYSRLPEFNTAAVSLPDTFTFSARDYPFKVQKEQGLLINDYDLDNGTLTCVPIEPPAYGYLSLNTDGSFTYLPKEGFVGTDRFSYSVFDGQALSAPTDVILNVPKVNGYSVSNNDTTIIKVFPSPVSSPLYIRAELNISSLRIFDFSGKMVFYQIINSKTYELATDSFVPGTYYVVTEIGGRVFANKILVKTHTS